MLVGLYVCTRDGVPGWAALAAGLAIGLGPGNPHVAHSRTAARHILALCVVLLGFGLDFGAVLRTGAESLLVTLAGVTLTLLAGVALGAALGVDRGLQTLISVGTAICGGSAIAAVAPAIRAREQDAALAMATVFVLNGLALIVFPPLGHALGLSPEAFGRWAALAIHDTSSVVGATRAYGGEALAIGTTMKLARSLWILPVAVALAWREGGQRPNSIPWFIPGFLIAAAIHSFVPAAAVLSSSLHDAGRSAMGAVLFLLGSSLTRADVRRVGARPMVLAVLLWALSAGLSLAWVR
jgi:uncharacterized integral membrane protein (TIGR00698 family)